ncbi:DUF541 domain-containing protein [bacterium]|nr:DUF541 domain-containing protein [bacterium]
MKTKTKKLNAPVMLAFLVAVVMISCKPQVTPGKHEKFKTIMLRSEGSVITRPDMAEFSVTLNCLDKSLQVSKACLEKQSKLLLDQLKSMQIAEEDILTTGVDMNKEYQWEYNTSVFKGYKSSTILHIVVRKLDALGDIYSTLLQNENYTVGGLSYTHSKYDSLENEAYAKALENAKTLAEKLLQQLPEDSYEILKIGNVALSASNPGDIETKALANAFKMEESAGKQKVVISAGNVQVRSELFVEFQMK